MWLVPWGRPPLMRSAGRSPSCFASAAAVPIVPIRSVRAGIMEREPCPDRIWDDVGIGFAMGCIGGGIFHSIKGFRNAPRGERLIGSLAAIKARAPVLGGNFAAWGGCFSAFDCAFAHVRGKEDPWNAIASGFVTGGVLALRGGVRVATRQAIFGGVILAMIEGVGIGLTRLTAPLTAPQPSMLPEALPAPPQQ